MKPINYIFIALGIVTAGLIILISTPHSTAPTNVGNSAYAPTIYSMTNTSTTVNTTSTTVVPQGWQNLAVISAGSTTLSCYLDNQTAASSSVQVGAGFLIQANTRASFGPLGDTPYVGAINCRGAGISVAGVVRN